MWAIRSVLLLALTAVCMTSKVPAPGLAVNAPPSPPTTVAPKNATYLVTFNRQVRPGQTAAFNVHIIEGTSPVTVVVTLLSHDAKKNILQSQPTVCQPGVVKTIPIKIPYDVEKPSEIFWHNNFVVRVVGVGDEVKFKEEGRVTLREKAFSVFIQTDKAMYKPGQEVKFRVAAVTPELKMMKDAIYDILVMDSKNNRIRNFRAINASDTLGVVQQSLLLADKVPTGEWVIEVNLKGMTQRKEFTVSDYVLPKYEVEIDAPPFLLTNVSHLNFTVKAKYTFGQPVSDSEVVVEIKTTGYYWLYRPSDGKVQPIIRLRGMLNRDGKYDVSVTKEQLLGLVKDYNKEATDLEWQNFLINATVEEERTKKKRSATYIMDCYATPMKITFLGITSKSFKKGLNFTAYLEVRKRDESLFTPEEAKNIMIKFKVNYGMYLPYTTTVPPSTSSASQPPTKETQTLNSVSPGGNVSSPVSPPLPLVREDSIEPGIWNPPRRTYVTRTMNISEEAAVQVLPDNGWIVLKFAVALPDNVDNFNIVASSEDPYSRPSQAYFYAREAKSPTDSFLQLNVTNHKPKVNDVVKVIANATRPMNALNFQLSSKGTLLLSKTVTPTEPSMGIEFSFTLEASMSPNLNLLAFSILDNGEFIVDAISFSVEGLFANPVDIKFSKDKVKPGEDVDVIIKAKQDSMVFLLAVDKSVKLLKSGNDITQELVRQELLEYEYGGNYFNWRYMFICGWPSFYSGLDAATVFSSAGVVVLTDGNVYSHVEDFFPEFEDTSETKPVPTEDGTSVAEKDRAPSSSVGSVKTRTFFPENWLWDIVTIPSQSVGEVTVNLKAPDTITSWVASAFSAHPTDGLSVGAEPVEVTTFRDLFVSLDLPSSIMRNEDFCFTASVFSYYKDDIPVTVKLAQSYDFKDIYTKKDNDSKNVSIKKKNQYHSIFIGMMSKGDIESVMFCFTPEVIGNIPINVAAITNVPGLSDAVERKLRVKPEGVPRTTSKPFLVQLENGKWKENITARFPPQTVSGSEKIFISVAGNFLGPIFENMEGLIKQPYGCGEQNMINFSPLMSLMKYFEVTKTATPEIRKKITDFMRKGYQKELRYEHGTTGGYSTFGEREETEKGASTWLTDFVMKCFAQAQNVLDIDEKAVKRSALFITSKQNRLGAFIEEGRVFNKRLQGGSAKGVSLTAYSIIALHEATAVLGENSDITQSIRNGVSFLESNIDIMNDTYEVCITAYALHLSGSKQINKIFTKMEQLAYSGSGGKYWERQESKPVNEYHYYWTKDSNALSVEMTAYALLTYSLRGIATTNGLSIVSWLSKQKNPNGGFYSTQDTVIAIEALTTVAAALHDAEYIPMTVTVAADGVSKSFNLVKENEMLLQRFEVPYQSGANGITIEAVAYNSSVIDQSTALVEFVMDYNVERESVNDMYRLGSQIINNNIEMKVSTVNGELAGMTIIEVELPAGYFVDLDEIQEINQMVSKAEMKEEDLLALYFDTDVIGPKPFDVFVPLERSSGALIKSKPKVLKLYSYYEPGSDLTVLYSLKDGEFCSKVPGVGVCPYL